MTHFHLERPRANLKSVALEIADFEILDENVGVRREFADDLLALGARHVDRDRLFAAIAGEMKEVLTGRLALGVLHMRPAVVARVVAPARALDLDHLRAEIGEIFAARGPASTRESSSTRTFDSGSVAIPYLRCRRRRRMARLFADCQAGSRAQNRAPAI
jgi:hypothetical protein